MDFNETYSGYLQATQNNHGKNRPKLLDFRPIYSISFDIILGLVL